MLSMIAIVSTWAWPRLNATQYRMDGNVRLTRMALQNAQRLAITRQFDVIVSFDVSTNRIRVLEDGNNNQAADAGERVLYRALEDGAVFDTPPAGMGGCATTTEVCGSNIRTIDGMPSIIFRRDGAASTDLEVYITSSRALNDDYRGVSVIQATGRTDWMKYIGGTWRKGSH